MKAETASGLEPSMIAEAPTASTDWMSFLRDHIDQSWRSDEWDNENWFFRGDPLNPRTRIYLCKMLGCSLLTDVRNGPCQSCRRRLRSHGGDQGALEEELQNQSKSPPVRGLAPANCIVERDGEQCSREEVSKGLCRSHRTTWINSYKHLGMTGAEYAATSGRPLPSFGACIVPSCGRERESWSTEFCATHKRRFRRGLAQSPRDAHAPTRTEAIANMSPVTSVADFALAAMPEQIRLEYLAAIQADDRAGYALSPEDIRGSIADLLAAGSSILDAAFLELVKRNARRRTSTRNTFQRRAITYIQHLRSAFDRIDPTAGDVWDSYLVGLQSNNQRDNRAGWDVSDKYLAQRQPLDFTPIRQVWLRELVKAWARETRPCTQDVACAIRGFALMSGVLSSRRGGDDRSTVGARDVQKTVEAIDHLKKKSGEAYSHVVRSRLLTMMRRILHYLHGTDHLEGISRRFVVTPEHRVAVRTAPQRAPEGRGLPNRVVEALHRAIPSLPRGGAQTGSSISADTLLKIHQTALRVLIDTGRRPGEIASLRVGCVTSHPSGPNNPGGIEYTLTYDNMKAGRFGRTLPIGPDTARAILEWEAERANLGLPPSQGDWLFPSPSWGRVNAREHLTTAGIHRALARLVASAPGLESDVPDRTTGGYVLFTGTIIPYSFRHAYAQRHADSGVPQDTLQELMDHRDPTTTSGYYQVSAKRKREAVSRMAASAVDSQGYPAPFASTASYEIAQIPTPFGGCTDPTNVKAGGGACPIRFQCAGCSMFRPDPSYLPAIEEHLVSMRATLLMVEIAGTAAPWVLQHQRDEIASFEQILSALKKRVASMADEEQEALEAASVAMRRLRASRPLIPLSVRRNDEPRR